MERPQTYEYYEKCCRVLLEVKLWLNVEMQGRNLYGSDGGQCHLETAIALADHLREGAADGLQKLMTCIYTVV